MNEPAHLHWGADALQQTLEPLLPGLTVEVVASLDSTNTRLLERARAGAHAPCLLVAEQQTRGRGRLGRGWASNALDSLTFSLALPLAPADWSGLSLAVGLALAEALDPVAAGAAPRIGLKWPNDLWLIDGPGAGRKLGGVLIETVSVGAQRWCVIGVGLNVRPVAVEGLATACLQELQPQALPPQALVAVALPLVRALQAFEPLGFAPLVPAYARRDLLLGQPVSTGAGGASGGMAGCVEDGIADGVDGRGALRLRRVDGNVSSIVSGEVSVRLRRPAASGAA